MSETGTFRTVLRGYEPAQVDQRVGELVQDLRASQDRAVQLGREVESLQHRLAERRASEPGAQDGTSDYTGLGARIGQLLTLAEEEAADLVARARADAEASVREAGARAGQLRAEADRYDAAVRGDARAEADRLTAEAERLTAEAQRRAEDLLDAAERDARSRREEGGALEEQLAAVQHAAGQARARCEQEVTEATSRARRLLEDAQEQADRVVTDARQRADQVRAESERGLSAASQRRDSINAQLAHVRQVLAALSGSVPGTGVEERRAEARAALAPPAAATAAAAVPAQAVSPDQGPAAAVVDLRRVRQTTGS